jgi:hypothetical protein
MNTNISKENAICTFRVKIALALNKYDMLRKTLSPNKLEL